jgi:hypothetical protein
MKKIIILTILVLILVFILSVHIEGFMVPNTGVEEKPLRKAQYSNNYINEFKYATVSPMDRIAVLRNTPPSTKLTDCDETDCPTILKEKGFDCFKCTI